MVLQHFF